MSEKDYFIDFARQLGELNGNISAVLQRLEKGDAKMADHEARLSVLEDGRGRNHAHQQGGLPQWAIYLIVALASILAGIVGVKVPSFF